MRKQRIGGWAINVAALIAAVALVGYCSNPDDERTSATTPASAAALTPSSAPKTDVVEVNLTHPVYTRQYSAYACPVAAAFTTDHSQSLAAANEALKSMFSTDEKMEKVGCKRQIAGMRVYPIGSYQPTLEDGKSYPMSEFWIEASYSKEPVRIDDRFYIHRYGLENKVEESDAASQGEAKSDSTGSAALRESRKAREEAEKAMNAAWKSLTREQRQSILQEQRDFNRIKEEACERVALAAGTGEQAEIAGNNCWASRYKSRTVELEHIPAIPNPSASEAEIFGNN